MLTSKVIQQGSHWQSVVRPKVLSSCSELSAAAVKFVFLRTVCFDLVLYILIFSDNLSGGVTLLIMHLCMRSHFILYKRMLTRQEVVALNLGVAVVPKTTIGLLHAMQAAISFFVPSSSILIRSLTRTRSYHHSMNLFWKYRQPKLNTQLIFWKILSNKAKYSKLKKLLSTKAESQS